MDSSSTSVMLSIEILMGVIKPVVKENYEYMSLNVWMNKFY